ncbi:hypothetical protein SAMN06295885_0541 [Rathayibacter oskolensis]|uniref:DUF3558 domain-containing protein n=1 Tax=Rathayibacter oskolensis TaxID=1891671 RepID=A0A1X7N2X3_9MICO|nr:hypothetical protein [Rathayibacter oskolensis]SMH31127.1 hypothetical protein SAMN06295885_0541 [Rathayibacter oskolensis]
MRLRLPVLLTACVVLALTGCSSDSVIDVPESSGTPSGSTDAGTPPPAISTPVETASAAAGPAIDCATALPSSVVEESVGLPAGTVSAAAGGGDCTYSIAGNPSALVLRIDSAPLAETFTGGGEAKGATPAPLGAAAYWLAGDPRTSTPSELAVLAGGYELHIVSFVGDQGLLVDWAVSAFAAVDVSLVVA